jgi:sugar/nucleoside kinase (ribokinase family)
MKPILVAGEINVDLVFGGCPSMPMPGTEILAEIFQQVPGSSSMICAMGLARLGEAVSFVGRVGDDERGRFCLDALRTAGIDVTAVRNHATLSTGLTVAISTAADRALVTFPGAIAALSIDDVSDALLESARHLHVSSYFLQARLRPHLPALFARAHALGLSTSLDPGHDPEHRWGDFDEWQALLRQVDAFLPNQIEVCAITRTDDVQQALTKLTNGVTQTVVKCAENGAVTLDSAHTVLQVATRSPDRVADSTGAGDSFDAGFLHAWLSQQPLGECLRWGNACGSLSLRGFGGTATQADISEVRTWLKHAP